MINQGVKTGGNGFGQSSEFRVAFASVPVNQQRSRAENILELRGK